MDDGVAMKRRLVGLLISLYAAILGGDLAAETLLTVHPGGGVSSVELSRADLAALPQGEVLTSNEFVDGEALFRGPLAREVLKSCGSRVPETVTMTAVNDYQIEVPTSEFFATGPILSRTSFTHSLTISSWGRFTPAVRHKNPSGNCPFN